MGKSPGRGDLPRGAEPDVPRAAPPIDAASGRENCSSLRRMGHAPGEKWGCKEHGDRRKSGRRPTPMPRRLPHSVALRLCASLVTLAAVVSGPRTGWAGGSAPILSITGASAVATSGGVRALTVTGTFNFDDLLQFSFPAGLVVVQGSHFVRYDLSGQIVEGTAAFVADGIDVTEIPTLLPLGAAATAPAALGQLRVDRIAVTLPADLIPGTATLILYAVLQGDPFVSNTVTVTLP